MKRRRRGLYRQPSELLKRDMKDTRIGIILRKDKGGRSILDVKTNTIFNGGFTKTEQWCITLHFHGVAIELDQRVHIVSGCTVFDMMD